MKKLLYLTNIPAPYRQKRFNAMQEIFPKFNLCFEVLYMASKEPNRSWIVPEDSFKYKYKIFQGFHPTIGKFYAHFNPKLLFRLLKKDYNIIIIGGLANPTLWFASFFVPSSVKKIISIETNLKGNTNKTGLTKFIKRYLLNRADAYQCTGQPQIDYIKFFSPKANNKKFILLPNLIDGDFFIKEVDQWRNNKLLINLKEELCIDKNTQLWIVPSRLDSNKIPDSFLKATSILKNVRIVIVGDGPRKAHIEEYIRSYCLPITLLQFVQQQELVKYLAAADVFCLASLSDASPLSVIEACAAALPIIVSNTIGNLDDVLLENENGFSFNPHDSKSIEYVFSKISYKTTIELKEMGKLSRVQYNKSFNVDKCIELYSKQINELLKT